MNDNRDDNQSGAERETPENWEYYAGMLREYRDGVQPPDSLRVPASVEVFESEVRRRNRVRAQRWLVGAPALTLLLLVGGTLLNSSFNDATAPVAEKHQEVNDPAPLQEPVDIFASPDIPPVWIDSGLEAIELPGFPGIDMELADSILQIHPMIDTPVAGE